MKKIRVSISINATNSFTSDFEIWLNDILDKHQINYMVNKDILENVISIYQYAFDNEENREEILQRLLSNPDIKTLKDIRREKLNKLNENC